MRVRPQRVEAFCLQREERPARDTSVAVQLLYECLGACDRCLCDREVCAGDDTLQPLCLREDALVCAGSQRKLVELSDGVLRMKRSTIRNW